MAELGPLGAPLSLPRSGCSGGRLSELLSTSLVVSELLEWAPWMPTKAKQTSCSANPLPLPHTHPCSVDTRLTEVSSGLADWCILMDTSLSTIGSTICSSC